MSTKKKIFFIYNYINLYFINSFRADNNHDQQLSKDELLNYVLKNVNQHLREGKQRNTQLFILIDSNQDG